eukprot:960446-Pyramimonas_sp.AAC.1
MRLGAIQGCQGATVTLTRGAEVPGMVFAHDLGSPRRNRQADSCRWSPENYGPLKRELGGRAYSNILDEPRAYTDPIPSPILPPPPRLSSI